MGKHPKITVEEKSWDEIKADCREWAKEIQKEYQPDLIVFIAKSGFAFAQPMNEVFQCDMADIIASRPATGAKDVLRPIIERMPKKLVYGIISSPISYWFHGKNDNREIVVTHRLSHQIDKDHKRVLVVDDSVDSGWTMLHVRETVRRLFPTAMVRVASYCIIDEGNRRTVVDYHRHLNYVIITATSRRSEEYSCFLKELQKWTIQTD